MAYLIYSRLIVLPAVTALVIAMALPCSSANAEDIHSGDAGQTGVSHMVGEPLKEIDPVPNEMEFEHVKNQAAQIQESAKASSVATNAAVRNIQSGVANAVKAQAKTADGTAKNSQGRVENMSGGGGSANRNISQYTQNHSRQILSAIDETKKMIQQMQQIRDTYQQSIPTTNDPSLQQQYRDLAQKADRDIGRLQKMQRGYEAEAVSTQRETIQANDAAAKFEGMEKTADGRGEDMSSLSAKDALAFAQQAAGGAGGGGSGSSGSPGAIANPSGSYPGSGMAFQGGSTSQSRSPANIDGTSFDKNSRSPLAKDDFGNLVGSGSKFSGSNTTSSSVGSLKDKLRGELAGRKSLAATPPPALAKAIEDAKAGKAAAKSDLLNPEANASAGSEVGDLGLAVGLGGSGDFGDMLKGVLGINPSEQNLSEEEKALLESRRLASLSSQFAPLPPEVLGADTQNLFKRTRERIEASLKRGKVMNGLNSKL